MEHKSLVYSNHEHVYSSDHGEESAFKTVQRTCPILRTLANVAFSDKFGRGGRSQCPI